MLAILRILTSKERQKLREFIALKPKHYRDQVAELYELLYLNKRYLELSIEPIHLPGFDKKRLPDLMNKLLEVVEQFCVVESILLYANKWDKARHLMAFLYNHNLTYRYELHKGKSQQNLLKKIPFFPEEYLGRYLYLRELAIHEKITEGRKLSIPLNDYVRSIDVFYLIARLKLLCEDLSRPQVIVEPFNSLDPDPILLLARAYESESVLISIYLLIAKILKQKRVITVSEFSSLVNRLDLIPASEYWLEEYTSICHALINFSLTAAKNGNQIFHNKFLALIEKMEKKGVLLENRIISPPIFKAAISMLLKSGEIQKAEIFFNRYRLRLPEKNDIEIRLFCKALIAFHKKDFKMSSTYLRQIHKPLLDGIFLINTKKLAIQILVEETYRKNKSFNSSTDQEELEKKLRNFHLFLNQTSLSKEDKNKRALNINKDQRARALNFVSYLRQIVFHSQKIGKAKELKSKLHAETKATEKEWLLSLLK